MYYELRPLLVALSISIFFVWLWTVAHEADGCFSSPYKPVIDHRYDKSGSKKTAGDRKLGFSSIKYINMPNRFDRSDAATLQAYLSRLDLEYHPAVGPSDIHDVGMPPSSNLRALNSGEKGCWRAHANIWAEMLRQDIPTVLILESDAAWDINIRPIMAKLSKEFGNFLRKSGSQPLYRDHEKGSESMHGQTQEPVWQDSDDDPWHSSHWDIFSLGPCYDELKQPSAHFVYHDPLGPASTALNLSNPTPEPYNATDHQQQPPRERMIYRSGGPVCTAAYAITKRGAAKLLARTAMNLNAPLDMIIRYMVKEDQLIAYGTVPTVMAQWDYVQGIGMEKRGINGVGSDILRGKVEDDDDGGQGEKRDPLTVNNEHEKLLNDQGEEGEEDNEMPGWENVMKANSVWTLKPGQPQASFEEMALQKAWEKIFSTEKNIEVR